jgi:hypothetical protein
MNVTFKTAQVLGNRPFKAGTQALPDHLAGNQKFKQLVRDGAITVHARTAGEMEMQAAKDSMSARKADAARKQSAALQAARKMGADVTELVAPGTAQKIADKKAAKA